MTVGLRKLIQLERNRRINNARKNSRQLMQLFWECTLRCNLKCLHCGSDCKVDDIAPDMPFEDFEKVLDDISSVMNPRNVLVITTGGEPLVRKDLVSCGRRITEKGFSWGMVSNGMLLSEEKLSELTAAGLRTIAISLDGFEEDHNWMRGNDHSFLHAVNAIKALVKSNIKWDVITCVNRRNIATLAELKDFLYGIGVREWRVFTIVPMGRAKDNPELSLDDSQIRQVMDFIVETRREGKIDLSYSCEGFLGEYENEVRNHQFLCIAGTNAASILSDGSISGCLSIRSKYHQGNIYTDKFTDVWKNRFQLYRDHSWMKTGECKECDMWRYCEGNGMHLRDDDGNLMLCNYNRMNNG